MKNKTVTLAACILTIAAGSAGAADIINQNFGDIAYKTTRLSTNESNYLDLPTQWAKAYGSFNKKLKLAPQIAEMVRLRVGQIDNCNYCNVFHTRDALETGMSPAKVYAISTWRSSELFSAKERAALAYAETLAKVDNAAMPEAYAQLDKVGYSAVEKEELTNCAILMSVWSRLFLAQGKTSYLTDGPSEPKKAPSQKP
ncbi:carboxymuconolactone decarboxylase family protein [Pseudomonas sp. RL_15y_Pfl2_60]|uniref:carboxymuconolactone decarboxylase family protein n=1 Tax=Pseudomonas sp. RL_15y_Pfl2_60 TaxID=3088709 RepID=UPI0030DC9CA4